MVAWVSREQWGARPPEGRRFLVREDVDGTGIHWPGMAKKIDVTGETGFRRACSALRGWQAYHMDGRGWSDIAYQAAVDNVGRKYTLRGLTVQSAANGNQDVNQRYGAILLILAPGETISPAMASTVREVISEFRLRFPQGTAIKPHSAIRPDGTDCPGPAGRMAIATGRFTPGSPTEPPPPKDWFDMASIADLEAALKRVLPAIVAAELDKQDVDLWINGTGKSQVIEPLKRIEAELVKLPDKTSDKVMGEQIVNVLAEKKADGTYPTMAFSSHVAYGPGRVVEATKAAQAAEAEQQ
jgi:hypothetical protein